MLVNSTAANTSPPLRPARPPQLTGFAMPLQDAMTGAGILNLPYGPFPLPVPLVTVVGPPLALPPFDGEAGRLWGIGRVGVVRFCRCASAWLLGCGTVQEEL